MLLGAFQRERRDLCADLQVRGQHCAWGRAGAATRGQDFGLIRGRDLVLKNV